MAGTTESAFKSNLGYSGEQWDASLRMQNLRARAYDPANGRFIGLDPFAGNMQDPQSLHKYAYVHGDPIGLADPSGWSAEGWVYQAVGTKVHHMFSVFAYVWGWSKTPGAELQTILPNHFRDDSVGRQKPDLVSVDTREYFELKPVTQSRDAGEISDIQLQLGGYDAALQPIGFRRGESSSITLGLPRMPLGVVRNQGKSYLVELWPAKDVLIDGSNGRGLVWYELTELKKDEERKRLEEQPKVELPAPLGIPSDVRKQIDIFDHQFGEPGLQHDMVTPGIGIATLVAFRLAMLSFTITVSSSAATVTGTAVAGSIGTSVAMASMNATILRAA